MSYSYGKFIKDEAVDIITAWVKEQIDKVRKNQLIFF